MQPPFSENDAAFASLSPEKQQFLQSFAAQQFSSNPTDLAGQLSDAVGNASARGLQFSGAETSLLINLLKQNMSPEQQAKTDQMIALFSAFSPRK